MSILCLHQAVRQRPRTIETDSITCGKCREQFNLEELSKYVQHKATNCRGESAGMESDVCSSSISIRKEDDFEKIDEYSLKKALSTNNDSLKTTQDLQNNYGYPEHSLELAEDLSIKTRHASDPDPSFY